MYARYQIRNSEEAVLCRLYGNSPIAVVPDELDGCPVTVIGAYCFSDRNRVPEDIRHVEQSEEGAQVSRELAGDYVEEVVLPDTIRGIDNAVFLGCRNLKSLEIGRQEMSVGSDVFNNCSKLQTLRVRGKAGQSSAIRHILNRIPWELEVIFEDAVLLYPEYYESYDTIAPAHIFGLSIEGEGFRARQCFQHDVVDFSAYDDIFRKACAGETVVTLGRMALNRLMTPIGLTQQHQQKYEKYVRSHSGELLLYFVQQKELVKLEFICVHQYTDGKCVEQAACQAAQAGWTEGAAGLMEWKHQHYTVHIENRYTF